jgi:predicted NAD/FAD-binding protein
MKRIAIIGSGIAGTSAAYYLHQLGYEVSLFEAGNYFGGHTNTIDVSVEGYQVPIDTGFLVHNDRTYPNLLAFFKELDIATHPSEMSFSVVRRSDNLIWAGTNLWTVFAQFKNLFSKRFFCFLKEVLHFNIMSKTYLLESEQQMDMTLGKLLKEKGYSQDFLNWYLLPMGGSIWSTPTKEMLNFPAYTFLVFCMNHGLLQIFNRPQWKTVVGGCKTYVHKALKSIKNKYLNEPVFEVIPLGNTVKVKTEKREEVFDFCLMCTHPPEILKMLKGASDESINLLKQFKYQKNKAVLHFDETVLPDKVKARASWNYLSVKAADGSDAVSVSYLINKLQPLPFKKPVIVTLNPITRIDKNKVVKEIDYEHPLFSNDAVCSQKKIPTVQGSQKIYFAGAWMRYGFHEDGILSAKEAIKKLLSDDLKNPEAVIIL